MGRHRTALIESFSERARRSVHQVRSPELPVAAALIVAAAVLVLGVLLGLLA